MLNMVFDDKESNMSNVSKTQNPTFLRALCGVFPVPVTIALIVLVVFCQFFGAKAVCDIYFKHKTSIPFEILVPLALL